MKKKKLALLCAAALTVLTACTKTDGEPKEMPAQPPAQSTERETSSEKTSTEAEESYEDIVSTFEATTLAEASAKMEAGDEFYLYIGREDCPACKKFVPFLKKLREEKEFTVLYVDENLKDPGFPEYIEKYGLEFIPVLMRASEKKFEKLDYGKKITEESVRALFP